MVSAFCIYECVYMDVCMCICMSVYVSAYVYVSRAPNIVPESLTTFQGPLRLAHVRDLYNRSI